MLRGLCSHPLLNFSLSSHPDPPIEAVGQNLQGVGEEVLEAELMRVGWGKIGWKTTYMYSILCYNYL
jgi:hypothetical protein